MDIKDSVVRLYVKRYIIPKALIFDKPGFVDFKISGKTMVFARQILVPESFFIKLERNIIEKFGIEGEKTFYSIGKKFGYSFSQLGRFENINDHPGENVKDWVTIASKFVEGTYASNIKQTTDVKNKTVDYILKNFVICRKLGYDFFLATGGAAGVVAWILQEPKIEGRLYDSEYRRNDHFCKVKCAPIEILKELFSDKVYKETNVKDLSQNPIDYQRFNKEVEIKNKKSFQDFLDAKVFSYRNGIISYKNERFFLMEVTGTHLLELGMRNKKMGNIMFQAAFEVGGEIFAEFSRTNIRSIMELLSALGWGDVSVFPSSKKITVTLSHFPWTKYYKDVKYYLIGGLLSGIFSRLYNRKILFKNPQIDLTKEYLTLFFESE